MATAAVDMYPQPGPGDVERAFPSPNYAEDAVLRAIDAYPADQTTADATGATMRLAEATRVHQRATHGHVSTGWQIGRFIRRALDRGNIAVLRMLTHYNYGDVSTRDVVFMCLEFSLHPDTATAVRLFKDVVGALPPSEIKAWPTFATDMARLAARNNSTREAELVHHAVAPMPLSWQRWRQLQEFLAKATASLAIGSPFALDFDSIQRDDLVHLGSRLFCIYAYAFMQNDRGDAYRTAVRFMQASHDLNDTGRTPDERRMIRIREPVEAERRLRVLRDHLDRFIQLRWLPRGVPGPSQPQEDVIQLLANHLARSSIGDPRAIPPIMAYVHDAPRPHANGSSDPRNTATPREFHDTEFQVARAAVARAEIARAKTHVAAAPAAAAVPTPARSREDDSEQGGADAKRRM